MANQIRISPQQMFMRAKEYLREAGEFAGIKNALATMRSNRVEESSSRVSGIKADQDKTTQSLNSFVAMHNQYNSEHAERSKGLTSNLQVAEEALSHVKQMHDTYTAEAQKRDQDFKVNYERGDTSIRKMSALLTQLQSEWEGEASMAYKTKFDGELKPQFDKAKARVEEAQAEEKVIQKNFNEKFAKASEDFRYVQGFINELQRKEDEVKRFYDGKFKEAQKRYQSLNDFLLAFEESETRTQRMYDESFTAMEGVFENGSLLIEDISRKLDSAGQTMLAQDGAISKSFA